MVVLTAVHYDEERSLHLFGSKRLRSGARDRLRLGLDLRCLRRRSPFEVVVMFRERNLGSSRPWRSNEEQRSTREKG